MRAPLALSLPVLFLAQLECGAAAGAEAPAPDHRRSRGSQPLHVPPARHARAPLARGAGRHRGSVAGAGRSHRATQSAPGRRRRRSRRRARLPRRPRCRGDAQLSHRRGRDGKRDPATSPRRGVDQGRRRLAGEEIRRRNVPERRARSPCRPSPPITANTSATRDRASRATSSATGSTSTGATASTSSARRRPRWCCRPSGLDGYESYHQMADWGADILKVGESLGMGGFGYWDGKKAVLVSDVAERSTTIRSDGPIHASFELSIQGLEDRRRDRRPHRHPVDAGREPDGGREARDLRSARQSRRRSGRAPGDGSDRRAISTSPAKPGATSRPSAGRRCSRATTSAWCSSSARWTSSRRPRTRASQVLVLRPRGKEVSYAFGALWSGQTGRRSDSRAAEGLPGSRGRTAHARSPRSA